MSRALPAVCMSLLAGCAGVAPAARGPVARVAPVAPVAVAPTPIAPVAPVPVAPAACPSYTLATLEPAPQDHTPDLIAVRELYPSESRPTPAIAAVAIDLGIVRFPRVAVGDRGGSIGIGLGWYGLDPTWVGHDLSPDVAVAFASWSADQARQADAGRITNLLDERARVAGAAPPADGGAELRCVTAELARLAPIQAAELATTQADTARLVEILEGRHSRTAADDLVLGYLEARALNGGRPLDLAALARPLARFAGIVRNTSARPELRARAEEQIAEIDLRGRDTTGAGLAALRRVVTLTHDPVLAFETWIKIADLTASRAERVEILERLITQVGNRAKGTDDWRLAERLEQLATLRFEDGALDAARAAASRCVLAVGDEDLGDDPWGCARVLADVIVELGDTPPDNLRIPRRSIAAFAVELMTQSAARADRDTARHAAMLALATRPDAPEAPALLGGLIALTDDPTAKRELSARLAQDYAPGSPWYVAQRRRLAQQYALAQLDAPMAALLQPLERISPPPTTAPQIRDELAMRAWNVTTQCQHVLATAATPIVLRVDTRGPLPIVTANGASAPAATCLAHAGRANFRSVGAATITVTLTAE